MYHIDNMAQKLPLIAVLQRPQCKTPVDLDDIRIKQADVLQIGIAGAEIVKGNLNPRLFEFVPHLLHIDAVLQITALRQFHDQSIRGQPRLLQRFHDLRKNRPLSQLDIGQIDADPELGIFFPAGPAHISSLTDNPFSHGQDQPALLQDGNKFRRRNLLSVRHSVAQQRLRPIQLFGMGIHQRLKMQVHSFKIVGNGFPQASADGSGTQECLIVLLGKQINLIFPHTLGLPQGKLRQAHNLLIIRLSHVLHVDDAARNGVNRLIIAPGNVPLHLLTEIFIQLPDLPGIATHQVQNQKFIGDNPVYGLPRLHSSLNTLRHLAQHRVPVVHPQPLVDNAKIINAHAHHIAVRQDLHLL